MPPEHFVVRGQLRRHRVECNTGEVMFRTNCNSGVVMVPGCCWPGQCRTDAPTRHSNPGGSSSAVERSERSTKGWVVGNAPHSGHHLQDASMSVAAQCSQLYRIRFTGPSYLWLSRPCSPLSVELAFVNLTGRAFAAQPLTSCPGLYRWPRRQLTRT
jgi:hypothetical protein